MLFQLYFFGGVIIFQRLIDSVNDFRQITFVTASLSFLVCYFSHLGSLSAIHYEVGHVEHFQAPFPGYVKKKVLGSTLFLDL